MNAMQKEAVSRVVLAITQAATPALATEEDIPAARSQSEPVPQVWADFVERVKSLRPGRDSKPSH